MQEPATIHLDSVIERKHSDLPRYAVIPAALIKPWAISQTTTIELEINRQAVSRRSLTPWDEHRWFISITEKDCRALSVEVGTTITLKLRLAATALPAELNALMQENQQARQAWEALTPAQQRMLRENVLAAKQAATRTRRARQALLGE